MLNKVHFYSLFIHLILLKEGCTPTLVSLTANVSGKHRGEQGPVPRV